MKVTKIVGEGPERKTYVEGGPACIAVAESEEK